MVGRRSFSFGIRHIFRGYVSFREGSWHELNIETPKSSNFGDVGGNIWPNCYFFPGYPSKKTIHNRSPMYVCHHKAKNVQCQCPYTHWKWRARAEARKIIWTIHRKFWLLNPGCRKHTTGLPSSKKKNLPNNPTIWLVNLPPPSSNGSNVTPPRNKNLFRAFEPLVCLIRAAIKPLFLMAVP